MFDIQQNGNDILRTHSKKLERLKPSEYAERYRDMSSTSALKGKYSFDNSPYIREIADRFDDDDPTRYITVIKVPQSGLTAMLENVLCWVIAQNPCPMMILSGDDDLSEDVVEKRFDAAIDSCGIRHMIRPSTEKRVNKRTGDTSKSKEFEGGWCVFGSANNKKNFRQRSIKIGVLDDADAAKSEDTTEGSMLDLFYKRFTWYASRGMKACVISTPTIKGHSNVELSYSRSDKREHTVPCPKCGSFIVLEFQKKIEKEKFGLIFKVDRFNNLVPESVEYRCYECGEHFKEAHKYEMLNNGIWVPTNSENAEAFHAGYHIGGLMLPVGTLTWVDQAASFVKCYPQGFGNPVDVSKLKVFVNQTEGKTYEDRGTEIKANILQKNTRDYQVGIIPRELSREDGNGEIVLITFACDINGLIKGRNGDYDDIRIDWEIVAHTENKSTYSINHGSVGTFQRKLSPNGRKLYSIDLNADTSAWDDIETILTTPIPTDDGIEMYIAVAGIDEGFGTEYARKFAEKFPVGQCFTLKGDGETKSMPTDKDVKYAKPSTTYIRLRNILVNKVKDDVFRYMNTHWNKGKSQPPHYMNYPFPTETKYRYKTFFKEYEGEKRVVEINKKNREVSYIWTKKHDESANHFWDCRIYNEALAEIACFETCKLLGIDIDWINFSAIMLSEINRLKK